MWAAPRARRPLPTLCLPHCDARNQPERTAMPLLTRPLPPFLCCALLLLIPGCKRSETGASTGASPAQEPITQIDPATAGSVEGTVHLVGKAPERIEIDMAQDPACAMSPYGKNLTEGIVSQDGKLANVYVYVKDGLGNKVYRHAERHPRCSTRRAAATCRTCSPRWWDSRLSSATPTPRCTTCTCSRRSAATSSSTSRSRRTAARRGMPSPSRS